MITEVITQKNIDFVSETIESTSREREINFTEFDLWIVTGSFVINAQTQSSDVDLILLRDNSDAAELPQREKAPFQDRQVSISIVNRFIFEQDGDQQFGGYFTGKVLNPLHFIGDNENLRKFAQLMGGRFIGDFAGYLGKEAQGASARFSQQEIAAHALISYLAINPEYDSYLLRYFAAQNFELIWEFLTESISEALLLSGKVNKEDGAYTYSGGYDNYAQFNNARLKSVARRTGLGVHFHDSDYSWVDRYFEDAEKKIDQIDPDRKLYEEMVRFYEEVSGLPSIFV